MRVKNPYVKKGALKTTSPKTVGGYFEPCAILHVRGGTTKCNTISRLKIWLNANIIANF
jgi:hypothetical protein